MKNFKTKLSINGNTTLADVYYKLQMDYGEWILDQFYVVAYKKDITRHVERNRRLDHKLKQDCLRGLIAV